MWLRLLSARAQCRFPKSGYLGKSKTSSIKILLLEIMQEWNCTLGSRWSSRSSPHPKHYFVKVPVGAGACVSSKSCSVRMEPQTGRNVVVLGTADRHANCRIMLLHKLGKRGDFKILLFPLPAAWTPTPSFIGFANLKSSPSASASIM